MIQFAASLELNADKIIKHLGLNEGGAVQQYVDSQVLTECDPYVPMDTGNLKNSGILHTKIGSGRVIYNTPYARKMYYSKEYHFQQSEKGGVRGAYWFTRAMQNGGKARIFEGIKLLMQRRQK